MLSEYECLNNSSNVNKNGINKFGKSDENIAQNRQTTIARMKLWLHSNNNQKTSQFSHYDSDASIQSGAVNEQIPYSKYSSKICIS